MANRKELWATISGEKKKKISRILLFFNTTCSTVPELLRQCEYYTTSNLSHEPHSNCKRSSASLKHQITGPSASHSRPMIPKPSQASPRLMPIPRKKHRLPQHRLDCSRPSSWTCVSTWGRSSKVPVCFTLWGQKEVLPMNTKVGMGFPDLRR